MEPDRVMNQKLLIPKGQHKVTRPMTYEPQIRSYDLGVERYGHRSLAGVIRDKFRLELCFVNSENILVANQCRPRVFISKLQQRRHRRDQFEFESVLGSCCLVGE